MKTKLYYSLLCVVYLFAACKKDVQSPAKTTTQTQKVQDSVTYTVNGKIYLLNIVTGGGNGNTDAYLHIDPTSNTLMRSKDSLMFFNNIILSNTETGSDLHLSFFKKYSLSNMQKGTFIYYPAPKDQAPMYAPGSYTFATDYTRTNATDGVGIDIMGIGKTYTNMPVGYATTITQDAQKNSSFVVSSFTHVQGNEYLLIARFNATLFDSNEQPVNLTNGYMRLLIDYYDN